MKIIDAHMHYFKSEGFDELAKLSGGENTREFWQRTCEENHVVFSVAMGNSYVSPSRFGGVTPRLIDLGSAGNPFSCEPYNQAPNVGYCLGVQS
ncbi:MAG: amidohydrolase, partial [Succiniclasticum sp.]|nr:amidohydrolase [Succiniclasticum sp.]